MPLKGTPLPGREIAILALERFLFGVHAIMFTEITPLHKLFVTARADIGKYALVRESGRLKHLFKRREIGYLAIYPLSKVRSMGIYLGILNLK